MRAMKDSGIAWIGEIPEEWELVKTRRFFSNHKQVVGEEVDKYERLALTMNGVIKRSKDDSDGLQPEKFETYQILHKNELIFKLIDLENIKTSRVGLSPYTGLVSPAYIVLSSHFEDNRFFYYWFVSMYYNEVFNHLGGNGVRSALNAKDVLMLPVPSIQFPEQRRIADYLDRKCSQIDAIIARQQEVIEKLKAYKLSVITEAVTKGLNPHAPMKDSGVEWIGEIPEQWRMIRLKFLMSDIIDCPHETPAYSDDGEYLVIRTADQDLGKLRADQDMYRLNKNEYQNRIRRMALNKNDIVYGREGERWGLACLVPESNKYCLGQRMLQFRCKNELLLPHFAVWALNSKYIYLQGSVDTIGSTSPHVNISTVQNFLMPVPQICEQQEITEYIDKKMLQLDKDLLHRNTLIRKLIEYKKSLVYEVVTGKKEVI